MTITYAQEVSTAKRAGNFVRLLFRWKGSVYKLVWPDMFLYFTVYFIVNFYYRFVLVEDPDRENQRRYFESLVRYCRRYANEIPLSFILGFYVSIIVSRWWSEFQTFPWPDTLAYHIVTIVKGPDERSRLFRRSMMRFINLSFVLSMGMICPAVKLRFPTLEHYIKAGILLPHEKIIIETLNLRSKHPKYWVPLIWTANIAARARREGRITDDISLNLLITELSKFRGRLGDMLGYDWVNVPLVYSQAVTVATYLYFVANLLGKQFLKDQEDVDSIDIYVPVFQIFEFLFYMGWLRVAETLINPFGNDDDDFEVNYLIDRNFQTSYFIVDELYNDHPLLIKDLYWGCYTPDRLPYTKAAMEYKERMFVGTAMGYTHNTRYAEAQYVKHTATKEEKEVKEALEEGKQDTEDGEGKKSENAGAAASPETSKDPKIKTKTKAKNAKGATGTDKPVKSGLAAEPKIYKYRADKPDLYNRVALIYKLIAERKRRDTLNSGGYWNSITGPILADPSMFYEPENPVKYVPPVRVKAEQVAVHLRTDRPRKRRKPKEHPPAPQLRHRLKKRKKELD